MGDNNKLVELFFVLKVLLKKIVIKIETTTLILTMMMIMMISAILKLRELLYFLFTKMDGS